MALESSNNSFNSTRGVMGLFGSTNKAKRGGDEDESEASILPEFKSTMSKEEAISLKRKWEQDWDNYNTKEIKDQQKQNLAYWIGKQFNELQTAGQRRPLVDNLIFEAVETFLPIATRGNPEANVSAIGEFEGNEQAMADKLAKDVRNALQDEADRQRLRMKLKMVTRDWAIYMIGCAKITWDSAEGQIETTNILPSRLILDPNATIEVGGKYTGEYLGEKKRKTAKRLAEMFPEHKALISSKVDGNMGTKLWYVEWWTRKDIFFTIDDDVLGMFKNPHWNYDGEVKVLDAETQEETTEFVQGRNHFAQPEIPYIFLSIFNLGRRPHDETSLIFQNIPLQDTINRRYQQIDKNVDAQNNGIVLSGKYFTKEQAAEAATQLARGNPLWVPEGDIEKSYKRDVAPALPSDVFNHLQDARQELRNIFGTAGSSPEGLNDQKTARGKILVNQLDSSRIGGGVTEYIEQFADSVFNWWVQMMYVYYTEPHVFLPKGNKHGAVASSLQNTDFQVPVKVTVKDGSLVPKDPLTLRNEAMDLWNAQAIDPISLYERLDFPNPYEAAKELMTWQLIQKGVLPPQAMFPDLQAPPANIPQTTGAVSPQEDNANIQHDSTAGVPQLPTQTAGAQLMGQVPLP